MVRSLVGGIARFAGVAALVLGLAGALATPALGCIQSFSERWKP